MQRVIPIKPKGSFQKGGLKPNFALYNGRVGLPIIYTPPKSTSQFEVFQTTLIGPDGQYKKVVTENNEVHLLENTAFSIKITTLDPNNLDNPWDNSNTTYKWLKNGSYIPSANNLNDYKGVNIITFSAEQSTQNLTGNYTVEVTNDTGTTVSATLQLTIHNRLTTPELYNNIIQNSSGEAGTDNWDLTNGIVVNEFIPSILESKNFSSILIENTLLKSSDGEYYTTQPQTPFRFCSSTNWINFAAFYDRWKSGQPITDSDLLWWYANYQPNLVSNEDAGDSFACFFPSKRYMDDYNANEGKLGLFHEMKEAKTYFTKPPVQRDSDPVSKMTQTVDITNIDAFVDGRVCGVENVVGNFFAYVGLGLSSYEYRVKFGPTTSYGPKNEQEFSRVGNAFYNVQTELSNIRNLSSINLPSSLDPITPENTPQIIADRGQQLLTWKVTVNTVNATAAIRPWKYKILQDLYMESYDRYTIGINNTPNPSDFATVFAKLVFAARQNTYPETETLPQIVIDPGIRNPNGTTRTTAFNSTIANLNTRLEFAEDVIMNKVVNTLNQFFGYNLTSTQAVEKLSGEQYEIFRTIVHLLCSKHIIDFEGFVGRSGVIQKTGLITDDEFQMYQYYATSFASANSGFNRNLIRISQNSDPVSRFSNWYNFTYVILQFYVYEAILGEEVVSDFIIKPAAPDKLFNTLVLDFTMLKQIAEGGFGNVSPKYDLSKAVRIDIFPKCNDTVNFTFRYIDDFGQQLGEETLDGPTEDDLFAVKDITFLSTILTRLFQTAFYPNLPETSTPVTYKGGRELFTFYKEAYAEQGITLAQEFLRQAYPQEFTARFTSKNYPITDRGAAAFFGVNKTLTIPKLTRNIEVTATFNHNSTTWGLEADSGLNRYDSNEIPAEYLTDTYKFFASGNPRVGLAHMKLCLFDTTFKRTNLYPNYFVPPRNVWSDLKRIFSSQVGSGFDRILTTEEGDWQNFAYIQPTRESLQAPLNEQTTPSTEQKPSLNQQSGG